MSKGAQLVVIILLGFIAVGVGLGIGAARRTSGTTRAPVAPAPPAHPDILDDDENIPARTDVETAADVAGEEPLALVPLTPSSSSADRLMRPAYGKRLASFLASAAGARDDVVDAGAAPTFTVPEPAAVVDAGPVAAEPAVADAGSAAEPAKPAGIVSEQIPRVPLKVTFADELNVWLKLIAVDVYVDGRRVLRERDDEGLDRTKRARLAEAMVFPGTHQVRVELGYVGRGGVFAYMDAYKVRLRDVVTVTVPERGEGSVNATAFDKGVIEEWEKRPGLRLSAE